MNIITALSLPLQNATPPNAPDIENIQYEGNAELSIIQIKVMGTIITDIDIDRLIFSTLEHFNFTNLPMTVSSSLAQYKTTQAAYNFNLNVPAYSNILNLSSTILQNIYMKNSFLNEYSSRLTISPILHVNITQCADVIRILNNFKELKPFVQYQLSEDEIKSGHLIQIPINRTFIIPSSGIKVYITSPTHKFPLLISESRLTVEYI
jgi:hypothetical protein